MDAVTEGIEVNNYKYKVIKYVKSITVTTSL